VKKLLGAVFGTAKNTETIINSAVKGLDAIVFTDEEKAEANAKLGEWFLKYLQATHPQNLARRLIAIMVVGVWTWLIVMGALFYPWLPDYSLFMFETIKNVVNTPFSIIIGFYFATHLARAWQSGKK